MYPKLKSKTCRNLFRNERKVAIFMIGFYVGSIPTHRTMKQKIIGAILAGDRKIQVHGIEVFLSGYKIKPNSTRIQKERQAQAHAESIIALIKK